MAKKILRQAINVSPKELRSMADKMEKEAKEALDDVGYLESYDEKRQGLLVIINKQPKCSDTWEFEK